MLMQGLLQGKRRCSAVSCAMSIPPHVSNFRCVQVYPTHFHSLSDEDLQAHLRGRAHMVMVQRSEVAERSVYVRGFSNVPSAKDDLCEVMGQFGGVVSVAVVSTGPVVYALVEFASVESALRALRFE